MDLFDVVAEPQEVRVLRFGSDSTNEVEIGEFELVDNRPSDRWSPPVMVWNDTTVRIDTDEFRATTNNDYLVRLEDSDSTLVVDGETTYTGPDEMLSADELGVEPAGDATSWHFDESERSPPGEDDEDEDTPGTVVDDFEDGNLDEYSVNTEASVTESAAYRGDYGLELDGESGYSGTVRSDSGLNEYPGQNDEWEFWWNPQTLEEAFYVFFGTESDDYSETFRLSTNVDDSDAYVQLQERGTSGDDHLGHADIDISTDTWYRTVVDGTDSDSWTITVDTGEGTSTLGEVTTSETQYTWYGRSSIAYWISGADRVYLDDITIRTKQEVDEDEPSYVVDDFSDGDLEEWTIPSQTGTVELDGDSYSGPEAMRYHDDGFTRAFANADNSPSLDYFPQPGDMWEFYVKLRTVNNNTPQTRFYFGRQGSEDDAGQYEIQLIHGDSFRIQLDDGSDRTTIGEGDYSVDYDTGRWYRVRHWWQHPDQSEDHVCELYDVADEEVITTVSGDETTWNDGDIGVWSNSYGDVSVDLIRVLDRTG